MVKHNTSCCISDCEEEAYLVAVLSRSGVLVSTRLGYAPSLVGLVIILCDAEPLSCLLKVRLCRATGYFLVEAKQRTMTLVGPLPFNGPFIEPKLSWDLIEKRNEFLAQSNYSKSPIPAKFPERIGSPDVFAPGELDLANVTYELQSTDLEELESALQVFQSKFHRKGAATVYIYLPSQRDTMIST